MYKRILSLASAVVASMFSGNKSYAEKSITRGHKSISKPRRVRLSFNTSKYKPHQGERECKRRRIGGFYTLRQSAK